MLGGLQEKLLFRYQQTSRGWRTLDTVSANCGCPNRTLKSFKNKFVVGFNFLVPCCEGNPCCLKFFPLKYSPYSVVYDPTAFMACKLVIVAWLIAYGAPMKLRAPCGTTATCDTARHALVSRLLTKYLYQVTPPYYLCYK